MLVINLVPRIFLFTCKFLVKCILMSAYNLQLATSDATTANQCLPGNDVAWSDQSIFFITMRTTASRNQDLLQFIIKYTYRYISLNLACFYRKLMSITGVLQHCINTFLIILSMIFRQEGLCYFKRMIFIQFFPRRVSPFTNQKDQLVILFSSDATTMLILQTIFHIVKNTPLLVRLQLETTGPGLTDHATVLIGTVNIFKESCYEAFGNRQSML